MKHIIAFVVAAVGILCGIYVGGWLMFIQPMIAAASSFDAGLLTGTMVVITILKCIFATFVGTVIAAMACWIAGIIQILGGKKN